MKKWILILAVITAAAVAASPAIADRERWRGSGRGPGYVVDIAETPGLYLGAEQVEIIAALREAHLKYILSVQQELTEKSQDLRDLWLAPYPDRRQIESCQAKTRMVRDRLAEWIEAYNQKVYRILTPGQRATVQLRGREQGARRMGTEVDGEHLDGARRMHP
jgi:Spy/CpxP family protein refolding chaperone